MYIMVHTRTFHHQKPAVRKPFETNIPVRIRHIGHRSIPGLSVIKRLRPVAMGRAGGAHIYTQDLPIGSQHRIVVS